jgi:hypothetical protein
MSCMSPHEFLEGPRANLNCFVLGALQNIDYKYIYFDFDNVQLITLSHTKEKKETNTFQVN